jgi:hypothetical protein
MSTTKTEDLIDLIVNRDTPPDGRNDVVDWDITGQPITRGDVEAWSKAKRAKGDEATDMGAQP